MPSRVDDATLRAFLSQTTKSGNIEEVVEESSGLEAAGAAEPMRQRTVEKLAQGIPLSPAERFHLEAIIIPEKRPAIDIVGGDYSTRHQYWLHLNDEPIRARLRGGLRLDRPDRAAGSPEIALRRDRLRRRRRPADDQPPRRRDLRRGARPDRAPRSSRGWAPASTSFASGAAPRRTSCASRRVVMIHPLLGHGAAGGRGLRPRGRSSMLSTSIPRRRPAGGGRRLSGLRPAQPADVQNEVFGGVYGIKRLQPGELRPGAAVASYGNDVDAAPTTARRSAATPGPASSTSPPARWSGCTSAGTTASPTTRCRRRSSRSTGA